jgi:hypothetical protein
MQDRPPAATSRSNVLVLASLALSVISLFVAISGAATAGPGKLPENSVGTKQLKTGAVNAEDVRKAAITTRAMASGAVQSQQLGTGVVTSSALAPASVDPRAIQAGAVTTGKLSEGAVVGSKIGASAVGSSNLQNEAVTASKIGPRAVNTPALAIPELAVSASNLTTNVPMGNCQGMNFVPFNLVRSDPASMFNASTPTDLVAPVNGVYSLNLTMSWSHSDGYVRAAYVSRARGASLDVVGLPAADPGPAGYAQVIDGGTYELQAGDALRVAPVACGEGMTPGTAPTLDNFSAEMKWVAQPTS